MMFFVEFINELQNNGNIVDMACSLERPIKQKLLDNGAKFFNIEMSRNPLSIKNISAYGKLKKLFANEKYDIIHCHTPVAAMLTRIAANNIRKKGTKVIYTAHGFHFFKGAPLKNWLMYYPIEKYCSRFTDVLITINKEDYVFAQKKMKAKHVEYVPGVGIDIEKFRNVIVDKASKRAELGVPNDAFLLLSVGELNKNKNHETVIKAIAKIERKDIHYAIAGIGLERDNLLALAKKLNIFDRIHLLGFRTDINMLYHCSDICCFPSKREGLGLAAIEGMSCGLPLIASDIRGVRDYAKNGVNSFLCDPENIDTFQKAIEQLIQNEKMRKEMGQKNITISREYDYEKIIPKMKDIYNSVMNN